MQQLIQVIDETTRWSPQELTLLVVDYVIPQQWCSDKRAFPTCLATLNSIFLCDDVVVVLPLSNGPHSCRPVQVELSWISGHPHLALVAYHWYPKVRDETYWYRFHVHLVDETINDETGTVQVILSEPLKQVTYHQPFDRTLFCRIHVSATLDYVALVCNSLVSAPVLSCVVVPFDENCHPLSFHLPTSQVVHVSLWQESIYILMDNPVTLLQYSLDGQCIRSQHLPLEEHLINAIGFQEWIFAVEVSQPGIKTKDGSPALKFRYLMLNVATSQVFHSLDTSHVQESVIGLDQNFLYTTSLKAQFNPAEPSIVQRKYWKIQDQQLVVKSCLLSA